MAVESVATNPVPTYRRGPSRPTPASSEEELAAVEGPATPSPTPTATPVSTTGAPPGAEEAYQRFLAFHGQPEPGTAPSTVTVAELRTKMKEFFGVEVNNGMLRTFFPEVAASDGTINENAQITKEAWDKFVTNILDVIDILEKAGEEGERFTADNKTELIKRFLTAQAFITVSEEKLRQAGEGILEQLTGTTDLLALKTDGNFDLEKILEALFKQEGKPFTADSLKTDGHFDLAEVIQSLFPDTFTPGTPETDAIKRKKAAVRALFAAAAKEDPTTVSAAELTKLGLAFFVLGRYIEPGDGGKKTKITDVNSDSDFDPARIATYAVTGTYENKETEAKSSSSSSTESSAGSTDASGQLRKKAQKVEELIKLTQFDEALTALEELNKVPGVNKALLDQEVKKWTAQIHFQAVSHITSNALPSARSTEERKAHLEKALRHYEAIKTLSEGENIPDEVHNAIAEANRNKLALLQAVMEVASNDRDNKTDYINVATQIIDSVEETDQVLLSRGVAKSAQEASFKAALQIALANGQIELGMLTEANNLLTSIEITATGSEAKGLLAARALSYTQLAQGYLEKKDAVSLHTALDMIGKIPDEARQSDIVYFTWPPSFPGTGKELKETLYKQVFQALGNLAEKAASSTIGSLIPLINNTMRALGWNRFSDIQSANLGTEFGTIQRKAVLAGYLFQEKPAHFVIESEGTAAAGTEEPAGASDGSAPAAEAGGGGGNDLGLGG